MKQTGKGQDFLRWPPMLASKLAYLFDSVGAVNSDFPPTTQQLEVHRMFREQIATHRSQLDEVLERDLAAFNNLLRGRNIPNVIAATW